MKWDALFIYLSISNYLSIYLDVDEVGEEDGEYNG